ncbi:Uncharacterized protein Rs2_29751 [Raphanus sativus]|nr:Uncharacterized protein Rs2_29751 [Raphanus sativus]
MFHLLDENSLPTAALSGSEEFSPPEIKSKGKGKQSDEVDGKATLNVRKLSTTGLQSRKNKLVSGEELGDGVRRQGRTGRGFGSTRNTSTTLDFLELLAAVNSAINFVGRDRDQDLLDETEKHVTEEAKTCVLGRDREEE